MNGTLYLQLDENVEVHHPHVYLQDIAELSCTDSAALNRLRVMPVANLNPSKHGRYVMSAMDLVRLIQKKEPNLEVSPIGEPNFIITYVRESAPDRIRRLLKIAFVCLCSFFGAAFSIMTFNNDVDTGKLFSQIYQQVTGHASSGFTVLELSYSIGLSIGVLFFFNHFGRMKLTSDPTPMQVQMRLYEDNVNTTIIEDLSRMQKHQTDDTPAE